MWCERCIPQVCCLLSHHQLCCAPVSGLCLTGTNTSSETVTDSLHRRQSLISSCRGSSRPSSDLFDAPTFLLTPLSSPSPYLTPPHSPPPSPWSLQSTWTSSTPTAPLPSLRSSTLSPSSLSPTEWSSLTLPAQTRTRRHREREREIAKRQLQQQLSQRSELHRLKGGGGVNCL